MAVNSSRSENESLIEGLTDGKYRKARPNTEVQPYSGDEHTRLDRSHLHAWSGYGFPNTEVHPHDMGVPGKL